MQGYASKKTLIVEIEKTAALAIVNINLIHWPSKSDPLALA